MDRPMGKRTVIFNYKMQIGSCVVGDTRLSMPIRRI
jgi:hypothetical protein